MDDRRQRGRIRRTLPPMPKPPRPSPRFMDLDDVAVELAITRAQAYALVRREELPAIKIGGRGQWRVERAKLEEYIAAAYEETSRFIREHPLDADTDAESPPDEPQA